MKAAASGAFLTFVFPFFFRHNKPNLEDLFLELCTQDGDMETARGREHRKKRQPIVKVDTPKKKTKKADQTKDTTDPLLVKVEKSKANGVQIVKNGSTKSRLSNNNHDKQK